MSENLRKKMEKDLNMYIAKPKKRSALKKIAIATLPLALTGMLLFSPIKTTLNTTQAFQNVKQKITSVYKNFFIKEYKCPEEERFIGKLKIDPLRVQCNYHEIDGKIEKNIADITTIPELKIMLESILSEATKYDDYFEEAARLTGLDKNLIKSYIIVESGYTNFSPRAESHKGAIGPAQMLEQAARGGGLKIIKDKNGEILYDERRDIEKAIIGSAKFIKPYVEQNDIILGLASYNAGPNAVQGRIQRKKTDVFTKLFPKWETEYYTINVLSRVYVLKNIEIYPLNINKKSLHSEIRKNAKIHTLKKGETIHSLLMKYDTSRYLIEKSNPSIIDFEKIPAGIDVYVPEIKHKEYRTK